MDRYDREERSYDRGGRDAADSGSAGSPGDFPWQDSGAGDQPAQVWEEPPGQQTGGPAGAPTAGLQQAESRNPLAVTGFVLSLVMWIALIFPPVSFVIWILAVTFSSIGLSRARKLGASYKGLAVAGLCISLIGVVIVVLFFLFLLGAAVFGE